MHAVFLVAVLQLTVLFVAGMYISCYIIYLTQNSRTLIVMWRFFISDLHIWGLQAEWFSVLLYSITHRNLSRWLIW